ncbi:fused signal recognition particle receptor [Kosakonia oryzendophytica]|uniref:Signal recognition particle receptor FtsY n=1 Tax=Kosakonia oryzendophytica TaxID=1005665 RepID=A0A1C4C3X0_9ENTR|nr:signal recognition particle-docking protein FtsY [Kosakonia oryzendophytica]TDT51493.1 signal recognition particle-docking protein FtsY [Enterobacter sp. AG5470]SCC13785.1 fused signal recognition particle receptor [Kosakonia oryzendophytica]
MANEKKRGFFSWLGFGQKEQADEAQTEQQPVTEQPVDETPVAEPADSEKFAEEVVAVSETLSHEAPSPEPVAEETRAQLEHEELPLPEEVVEQESGAEEWLSEAEPHAEAHVDAEDNDAPLSDEELEAQALAAQAAEEAVVVVPVDETAIEQEKPTKEGFFARLKRSLLKTKENLGSGFISLFRGKKIDDDLFEELEEQLLIADVGVETTRKIITNLTEGASRKQLRDAEALYGLLKDEMSGILAKVDEPLSVEGKTPFVILMVGVNGVGKTTTIGKLARQFEQQGKSVMLAAGDTFRAAAVEQLQVWGQRNNIPVIAQHTGADSASVIFDAIQAAKARNVDVLIADTAGRLQNKSHLMEELKKIVRVMKKLDEDAPHEVMLTIDASTGQNAISQAKLFHEAVGLTGITLTKLDGTAKGGVIFSVADQFGIPIRYIGVGERIEDLRPFNAGDFIEALFARED